MDKLVSLTALVPSYLMLLFVPAFTSADSTADTVPVIAKTNGYFRAAPVISYINVIDIVVEPPTSVTVCWETDAPSTSQVEYGKTP